MKTHNEGKEISRFLLDEMNPSFTDYDDTDAFGMDDVALDAESIPPSFDGYNDYDTIPAVDDEGMSNDAMGFAEDPFYSDENMDYEGDFSQDTSDIDFMDNNEEDFYNAPAGSMQFESRRKKTLAETNEGDEGESEEDYRKWLKNTAKKESAITMRYKALVEAIFDEDKTKARALFIKWMKA